MFIAGPVNNKYGRRWAGFIGVVVLCVGAALQAGAVHLAMMIVGRIIAGLGTSVVATAVPLYISEVAPAKTRGKFVAMNQIGIVSLSSKSKDSGAQTMKRFSASRSLSGLAMDLASGKLVRASTYSGD